MSMVNSWVCVSGRGRQITLLRHKDWDEAELAVDKVRLQQSKVYAYIKPWARFQVVSQLVLPELS